MRRLAARASLCACALSRARRVGLDVAGRRPGAAPFSFDQAHPYAAGQHRGIDVGAVERASVRAPARRGRLVRGHGAANGKTVTIRHRRRLVGDAHALGSIGVTRGATVAEGDGVGTIGPSGDRRVSEPLRPSRHPHDRRRAGLRRPAVRSCRRVPSPRPAAAQPNPPRPPAACDRRRLGGASPHPRRQAPPQPAERPFHRRAGAGRRRAPCGRRAGAGAAAAWPCRPLRAGEPHRRALLDRAPPVRDPRPSTSRRSDSARRAPVGSPSRTTGARPQLGRPEACLASAKRGSAAPSRTSAVSRRADRPRRPACGSRSYRTRRLRTRDAAGDLAAAPLAARTAGSRSRVTAGDRSRRGRRRLARGRARVRSLSSSLPRSPRCDGCREMRLVSWRIPDWSVSLADQMRRGRPQEDPGGAGVAVRGGHRHLGHVAGFGVPADVFARYHRLRGNDVLMVSGTDEHGTPVMVAADREGVSPREIADHYNSLPRGLRSARALVRLFLAHDHAEP